MKYKTSKYNFFFPYVDGNTDWHKTIYNARTGSLALLDEEKYNMLKDYEEKGILIDDNNFVSDLKKGGFLVDEKTDEIDIIRYNMFKSRFSSSVLSLTIVPTSNCNFRCIYCYEKDKISPIAMSSCQQDLLVDFIENKSQDIKTLYITWYGGEPLLAIDIIEKLSSKFIDICSKNKISYYANLVTNGYLLNKTMVNKLINCNVKTIQITLDGDASDHNIRRPLIGGAPTYDKIIENLCEIKGTENIEIAIRINADKHNISRVGNVIDTIRKLKLDTFVSPYLAMVENINDNYNDNSCFRKNEFSLYEYDFIMENRLDIMGHLPIQIGNYCCADSSESYVINADGFIYKCWSELGHREKNIGTLEDGLKNNETLMSYLLYDPTKDDDCKECKFLPICMGGCPFVRKHNKEIRCTRMKYNMDKYMETIPITLANQR